MIKDGKGAVKKESDTEVNGGRIRATIEYAGQDRKCGTECPLQSCFRKIFNLTMLV